LRHEYTRSIESVHPLAAETLTLERTLSDLVNQAYVLTQAEIDLMWQTAPPRMPILSTANTRWRSILSCRRDVRRPAISGLGPPAAAAGRMG
jgi:hypothetical protein